LKSKVYIKGCFIDLNENGDLISQKTLRLYYLKGLAGASVTEPATVAGVTVLSGPTKGDLS